MRLTENSVRALTPGQRERIVWDDALTGFGVRVSPKGVRTFVVQYRNAAGRTRRMSLGRAGVVTIADARKRAQRALADAAQGEDPSALRRQDRNAATLTDVWKLYLEEADISKRYRYELERLWASVFERYYAHRLIREIDQSTVIGLKRSMASRPTYANRALSALSAVFSTAIKHRLAVENPVRGVPRFREEGRDRFLTEGELKSLFDYLQGVDDQDSADVVRLLTLTGARPAEILSMAWKDVDLASGTWTKPAASTKQRKRHRVPLNDMVRDLLERRREASDGGAYVFPGRKQGGHLTTVRSFWKRTKTDLGLPDVRLYDLRHSYASILLVKGINLELIGTLLGHSNRETTRRYAHLLDSELRAASDMIGSIFDKS